MRDLKKIEQNNLRYAEVIENSIAKPRSNEQLVSLCESVIRYLRYTGKELQDYNDRLEIFIEALCKLP